MRIFNSLTTVVAITTIRTIAKSVSGELQPHSVANFANIQPAFVVLFSRFQMFEHQRHISSEPCQLTQVRAVIYASASGNDFLKMYVHFNVPAQVFGVTRNDEWSQLAETLADEVGILVEALRAVDAIAYIKMNRESLAIDRVDQLHIRVRPVGQIPTHHFNCEACANRFDRVQNVPAVLDRCIKEFAGEIPGIRSIPRRGVKGARNIHAAQGSNCFGKGATLGNVIKILTALDRVGIKKILPGTHFGDKNILGGESTIDLVQELHIRKCRHFGTISCAIAKTPMLPCERSRIVGFDKDRSAETN